VTLTFKSQSGMAVTEYVVVSFAITVALVGFYGFEISGGETAMELMAKAFESYLGAISLSISLP
jgi:hypothetical protein